MYVLLVINYSHENCAKGQFFYKRHRISVSAKVQNSVMFLQLLSSNFSYTLRDFFKMLV